MTPPTPCTLTLLLSLGVSETGQEAVAAADPAVITWLQRRFGGRVLTVSPTAQSAALLRRNAGDLPPCAPEVTLA